MGPTIDLLSSVCWLLYKGGNLVDRNRLERIKNYLLERMARRV